MRRRHPSSSSSPTCVARAAVVAVLATFAAPAAVHAQDTSGALSSTRLKLPKGPGSLEGVGEDAEAQLNQGQASYSVPFVLPAGQRGLTPSLGLNYSSSGGSSVVGLGWSLEGPSSIERMTSRGLPEYDATDLFAAGGGAELARVAGGNAGARVYRERMEQSFSRYTWVDAAGTGASGYWKVEASDGTVRYYGARADGTLVANARLLGRDGSVFAYYLVETVDTLGHRIVHDYAVDAGRPYLTQVSWGFESFGADASARYTAELTYAARTDVLTDAKPGAIIRLTQRLTDVRVRVSGQLRRRYALAYESMGVSGGLSRLARVTEYGTDDLTSSPIVFSFGYARGLDPTCMGSGSADCARPYRRSVGSIGADLRNDDVDFLDMNGDALPDALDSQGGVHRVHLQRLDASAMPSFAPVVTSALAGSGSATLSSAEVELLDLDGDGRSDLVDGTNDRVLRNGGTSGDWRSAELLETHLPTMGADADLRFLDVDYDRQIDVIHLSAGGAWYFRNTGFGVFATSATPIANVGVGFTSDALKLADMNGDGLPDLVQFISGGGLWYFPNLGFGAFGTAITMGAVPTGWVAATTDLVDVSGDGLTDLVQIVGADVSFALNRDAASFGSILSVDGGDVEGGLPERLPSTSVRYVDMNANGTIDLVYVSPSGLVEYVELYSEHPNLLTRIDNGIGKRIALEYGTIAEHMARDGGFGAASGWAHTLPNPMVVLDAITLTDSRTNTPQRQQLSYRNGYWDPVDHQFRGFEEVWVARPGDAHVETGAVLNTFDVGATDRYRSGVALRVETRSDDRVLRVETHEWDDCPVAQAAPVGGAAPVRWTCSTRITTDLVEGLEPAFGVRTEKRLEHDAYGNTTATHELGVVARGGRECTACTRSADVQGEPCGATCLGDESHELVDYVVPGASTGGRWILDVPYRKRTYGVEGSSEIAEERTYFDGADFVGMPLGTLARGVVHRIEQRRAAGVDAWRPSERSATDAHGNVIAAMSALGHRRTFAYDGAGLLLAHEQVELDDPGHAPYALRMEVAHHPVHESIISATAWMRVEGGAVLSPPNGTEYAYDVLGRLVSVAEPGDALATPTQAFAYEYAEPVSRIVTRRRSASGSAAADLESVKCFDGLGRELQERTRVAPGRYQVSGDRRFDVHGNPWRVLRAHASASSACDVDVSDSTIAHADARHDAVGRLLQLTHPDAAAHGGVASVERTIYRPLEVESRDADDDGVGPHANTPIRVFSDGLGRVTRQERLSGATEEPVTIEATYDSLGRLRSWTDDAGNEQRQLYDLLGRIVETNHPDSGITRFVHDDADRVLERVDATSAITRNRYDEVNRRVEMWDAADPVDSSVRWFYDAAPSLCDASECSNTSGALVATSSPLLDGRRAIDTFGYDRRGHIVDRTSFRRGIAHRFHERYDNANRRVATTYPDTTTIERTLDGLGRITSVDGAIASVDYGDRGELLGVHHANGSTLTRTYDVRSRLTSLTVLDGAMQPILASEFAFSRTSLLTRVTDTRTLDPTALSHAMRVEHDALGRVHEIVLDEGRESEETLRYSVDRIGNLTSKTSSLGTESPEHLGRLTYGEGAGPHAVTGTPDVRGGAHTITHDAAGRMIGRWGLTQRWDHLGRLVSVASADAGAAALTRYAYDTGMERIEKQEARRQSEHFGDEFEVRDGTAIVYVFLADLRLTAFERNAYAKVVLPDVAPASAGPTSVTAVGDGRIDAGDAWLVHASRAGFLDLEAPNAASLDDPMTTVESLLEASATRRLARGVDRVALTFHHDPMGSIVASTDASGVLLDRQSFYPYGSVRSSSAPSAYGFTGQEHDRSVGLTEHTSRYLDNALGRWSRPDPQFELLDAEADMIQATEPYSYVAGSVVMATDGSGTVLNISALTDSRDRDAFIGQLQLLAGGDARIGVGSDGNVTFTPLRSRGAQTRPTGTELIRSVVEAEGIVNVEPTTGFPQFRTLDTPLPSTTGNPAAVMVGTLSFNRKLTPEELGGNPVYNADGSLGLEGPVPVQIATAHELEHARDALRGRSNPRAEQRYAQSTTFRAFRRTRTFTLPDGRRAFGYSGPAEVGAVALEGPIRREQRMTNRRAAHRVASQATGERIRTGAPGRP